MKSVCDIMVYNYLGFNKSELLSTTISYPDKNSRFIDISFKMVSPKQDGLSIWFLRGKGWRWYLIQIKSKTYRSTTETKLIISLRVFISYHALTITIFYRIWLSGRLSLFIVFKLYLEYMSLSVSNLGKSCDNKKIYILCV